MFRLFLALSFVFIQGTFAVSKNQSASGNFCQLIPRYGTQQIQCGKSVSKDSCSCRDGMYVFQLAELDIVPKWNLLFLDTSYFHFKKYQETISNYLNGLFKVKVVVANFTGSIQTEARQMTPSRLFATWKLRAEAGRLSPQRCPQTSSLSKQRSQRQQQKLRTPMQQVTSTRGWGTGKR